MERKHPLPHGVFEASNVQKRNNNQKTYADNINKNFRTETEDFPLLNDSLSNKNKVSGKFVQSTLSYSDKLKAVPQVPSKKICNFFGPPDTSNQSEKDSAKTQPLSIKSTLSRAPNANNLPANLNTSKVKNVQKTLKSFHSMPNQHISLSTRKKDQPDENKRFENIVSEEGRQSTEDYVAEKQQASLKSSVSSNDAGISDEGGWTVYQKHSLPRKKQMQNKTTEANKVTEKTRKSLQSSNTGRTFDKNFSNKSASIQGLKVQPGVSTNKNNFSNTTSPNISSTNPMKNIQKNSSSTSNKLGGQNNTKNIQSRTNHSQKRPANANEAKLDDQGTVKSKKKRKSKVKRLAALQANKLLIITPEAHTRILTHSTSQNTKAQGQVFASFTDNEEYPELGMGFVPKPNKKWGMKTSDLESKVEPQVCSETHVSHLENTNVRTSQISIPKVDTKYSEAKIHDAIVKIGESTQEPKLPATKHSNNRSTISLFDMLWTGKSKKKETEANIEEDSMLENSPVRQIKSKVVAQPINPLSSSKVLVKRGKEREKPKVKKPTKIRKLILLGRQMKRDRLASKVSTVESGLHSENNVEKETAVDNDCDNLSLSVSPGHEDVIDKTAMDISSNFDLKSRTLEDLGFSLLVSSCSKEIFSDEEIEEYQLLLQQLSLSTQSNNCLDSYTEESEDTQNSNLKIVNNSKDFSYESRGKTLNTNNTCCSLNENTEILKDFSDLETLDLQSEKAFNDSNLLENSLRYELDESKVSKFDAYFNTLVETIIEDCMSEINLMLVKNLSKQSNKNFTANSVNSLDDFKTIPMLKCDLNAELPKTKVTEYTKQSNLCLAIPQSQLTASNNSIEASNLDMVFDTKDSNSLPSNFDENFVFDNKPSENLSTEEHSNKIESSIENINKMQMAADSIIPSMVNENIKKEILEDNNATDFRIKSSELSQAVTPKMVMPENKKAEAAKILLHSRKFRDYCTHFVTKELDETIFTLIDDLARFQDRLHQKDPVKARMKRRLMYGIKEIKKHVKLKKLKGIIIATDIEDNKTEGGLNDLVKEMLTLAETYHIPYVFSHKRYNLGKVCRKPAPVSCVGIINYEGSEKNFKKMLEIQEECKCDYNTLTKKIIDELTDKQLENLFDAVQNSINLYDITKAILKELFGTIALEKSEITKTVPLQSNGTSKLNVDAKCFTSVLQVKLEEALNTCESRNSLDNFFVDSEKSCISKDTSEKLANVKIHDILSKYNVMKP